MTVPILQSVAVVLSLATRRKNKRRHTYKGPIARAIVYRLKKTTQGAHHVPFTVTSLFQIAHPVFSISSRPRKAFFGLRELYCVQLTFGIQKLHRPEPKTDQQSATDLIQAPHQQPMVRIIRLLPSHCSNHKPRRRQKDPNRLRRSIDASFKNIRREILLINLEQTRLN